MQIKYIYNERSTIVCYVIPSAKQDMIPINDVVFFYMYMTFVTAKRHLYESCDEFSPCEENSECRTLGHTRTCQCLHGHKNIDGRCQKGIYQYNANTTWLWGQHTNIPNSHPNYKVGQSNVRLNIDITITFDGISNWISRKCSVNSLFVVMNYEISERIMICKDKKWFIWTNRILYLIKNKFYGR